MIGMAKEGIVVEEDKLLEPWVAMLDEGRMTGSVTMSNK
jgi:hypothetical protein